MLCRRWLPFDIARAQHRSAGDAAGELRQTNKIETLVLTADLSLSETPARVVKELQGRGIGVDVLVNNAGFGAQEFLPGCRFNGSSK